MALNIGEKDMWGIYMQCKKRKSIQPQTVRSKENQRKGIVQEKGMKHLKVNMGKNRYRKYAEAKARIPKHLSAEEYEKAIKELARKFKI